MIDTATFRYLMEDYIIDVASYPLLLAVIDTAPERLFTAGGGFMVCVNDGDLIERFWYNGNRKITLKSFLPSGIAPSAPASFFNDLAIFWRGVEQPEQGYLVVEFGQNVTTNGRPAVAYSE